MACSTTSINLPDELGQCWTVTLLPNGQLQSSLQPNVSVPPKVMLRAFLTSGPLYELSALSSGMLSLTVKASDGGGFPDRISFLPGDGTRWWVYVNTAGLLFSQNLGNSGSSVVVGQLHSQTSGYPPSQQQGGVGTPVTDPIQHIGPTSNIKPDLLFPINEFTGRFRPGCGHSINSYEVLRELVSGCDASALIVCPICKYIQNIITPYDLIHTSLGFELIVG